jgi:hypothetical protein
VKVSVYPPLPVAADEPAKLECVKDPVVGIYFKEPATQEQRDCSNCKYESLRLGEPPCNVCDNTDDKWEPVPAPRLACMDCGADLSKSVHLYPDALVEQIKPVRCRVCAEKLLPVAKEQGTRLYKGTCIHGNPPGLCLECRARSGTLPAAQEQPAPTPGGAEVTVQVVQDLRVRAQSFGLTYALTSVELARTSAWAALQVMADLQARSDMGKEKYGTRLTTENGRGALMDAYQEALDLCCYLKQDIMEHGTALLGAYQTALDLCLTLKQALMEREGR